MNSEKQPIIKLNNVCKEFLIDETQVEVLKNINLEIFAGEFVVIYGHSGCGKSTLLNTITGLEEPTKGTVEVSGNNIYKFDEDGRARFRQNFFGVILQQPNWIRSINVIENVAFPLSIVGEKQSNALSAAGNIIKQMGMGKYLRHMPNKLSGGQQQKIAMCRTIITRPRIIVADEPTGNLDSVSGNEVMDILKSINIESGLTVLMVSHNQDYEKYATKIIHIKDGLIQKIVTNKPPTNNTVYNSQSINNKPRHLRIPYVLKLAIKSLFSHKIRTLLTATGISISVGFVLFLFFLGMGLQKISIDQVANIDAMQIVDVKLPKSNILKLDDVLIKKLKTVGNVVAVHPQISSVSKLKYDKSEIEGVIYAENIEYLKIDDVKLLSGSLFSSNNTEEVIISKAAQDQLSSENLLGKEISFNIIVLPDLVNNKQETKQFTKKLKVVGVSNEKNTVLAYTPISIFSSNDISSYSNLKVKINSKEAVPQASAEIENLGLKVNSIKETVDQINKFFNIFQLILVFGGSIAIIVACIGMFNTLTITLIEKTKEIGFMKIIGTVKRDIYFLFFAESIIIGFIGSFIGIMSSYIVCNIINYIITNIAISSGNNPVGIFYMPSYIVIIVLLLSFAISTITSYYPARRAARVKPLDALRYE